MVASSVSPHYLRVRTPREPFIESPAPIQQAYCITATGHPNNLNDSMLLALLLPPFTRKKGLPYRQPIHLLHNNTHAAKRKDLINFHHFPRHPREVGEQRNTTKQPGSRYNG